MDELISRIKLEEGNTEFWKCRFLGEGLSANHVKPVDMDESEPVDQLKDGDGDSDVVEDVVKDVQDEEADEEEEVEQNESQDGETIKDKEVEAKKPLQMVGVQLFKDADQTTSNSKKSRRKVSQVSLEVNKFT